MASVSSFTPQRFIHLSSAKPLPTLLKTLSISSNTQFRQNLLKIRQKHRLIVGSVLDERDIIPIQSTDSTDQPEGIVVGTEREIQGGEILSQVVGGFASEGRLSLEGGGGEFQAFSSSSSSADGNLQEEDVDKLIDRSINAIIVLAAGTFAISKLLTIDHDYWHGWTLYEILRYAPIHNWTAYEEALKSNPVFAKMVISGVVYSVGDWIAQCYEGKPIFEFDRARMFRSGIVGFTLHGSLSHYYYEVCEVIFPFHDWWVVPAKVAFDQTIWSAIWNSIYYTVVGLLRMDSPSNIFKELRATFFPMLTAGWKLWPFAHLITYGVIPVEQRLLWVDCVELIWVTILSTYSNEKSESRTSDLPSGTSPQQSAGSPEKTESCSERYVKKAVWSEHNLKNNTKETNGTGTH